MFLRKILLAGLLGAALNAPPAVAQYQTVEIADPAQGGFGGLYLNGGASAIAARYAVEANNCWFLREGGIQTRPGFTRIGNSDLLGTTPWLLNRIYGASGAPNFIVGDGAYLWKVGNNGSFTSDSILSYNVGTAKVTPGSLFATGTGTKWVRSVQAGDTLVLRNYRTIIDRVYSDSVLRIDGLAGFTLDSNYQIIFNYSNFGTPAFGQALQVGGNVIAGTETRGATVVNQNGTPSLLGIAYEGKLDSATAISGEVSRYVDRKSAFTTNEFSGYILCLHNQINNEDANGNRTICHCTPIVSNDAVSFTTSSDANDLISNLGNKMGIHAATSYTNLRYTVFAPVLTLVDTGTVFKISFDSAASRTHYFFVQDTILGHGYRSEVQEKIVEFLSGQLAGQFVHLMQISGVVGNKLQLEMNDIAFNSGKPTVGDKYAVYVMGAAARLFTWYNNQLIISNSRMFPNQLRFSVPGTIHRLSPSGFRVIGDRPGTSITQIAAIGSDLSIWQESDTWKLAGSDLSTATLINALSGIGCPAPRSLKVSGNTAYWLGLNAGTPTAFAWGGGGLKFNVVGQPSVFSGGDLQPISRPVQNLFKGITVAQISKAAAGFWEDHYILSVPDSGSTTLNRSYVYHIPTGRWGTATNFYGSLFHNATSNPDSGQLYYTASDRGRIFQFGGVESDTGQQIALAYTTGDITLGGGRFVKQLGRVEMEIEKVNTTALNLQVFKNLPAVSVGNFSLASGVSGYRQPSLGFNGIDGRSFRFRVSYQAGQGIKLFGFRFTYLPTGVP